ncbi:MAG: glutamate--tRNA ligase [Candidatus Marinimicrobia bacterium]|jgi:glutamyl-tRNA synthetase|nr:glutamate--tRNA ligase [Candidatus Neomarinimicrobiota bacterium]
METKVRFAPSPTGNLHVGGLRTALFNYLYAKKVGGKIILRIEDTDQNRKVEKAAENILDVFNQLNIHFDEGPHLESKYGPYFQSQRLSIYKDHIQILLDSGTAYPCFCMGERLDDLRLKLATNKEHIKYDRHCLNLSQDEIKAKMESEPYVIRMKVPDGEEVVFYDVVRERVAIQCDEIDDQVLIKSDGFPTYHFANVVDDHLMGITHVMRGEEWLPSTPKHVLLYQFFNWKLPKFIHLPLLLNPDKSKLSKRQGDVSVEDYLNKGYLPETLINFVALLGWHPKDEKELFSLSDLENEFSVKRINKSGAVFDVEKLKWMNGQYLKNLPIETIMKYAKPVFKSKGWDTKNTEKFKAVIENARKRADTIHEMIKPSIPFYAELEYSDEDNNLLQNESSQKVLTYFSEKLTGQINWTEAEIKLLVNETGEITGVKGKDLYAPLRISLFGEVHGPDIPLLIGILGIDETIIRIQRHI